MLVDNDSHVRGDLALSASNSALPPEKDRTCEVGAKAQVPENVLSVNAAVFDTEMTNARSTDPLEPALQTLAGTERVKGGEVGFHCSAMASNEREAVGVC